MIKILGDGICGSNGLAPANPVSLQARGIIPDVQLKSDWTTLVNFNLGGVCTLALFLQGGVRWREQVVKGKEMVVGSSSKRLTQKKAPACRRFYGQ